MNTYATSLYGSNTWDIFSSDCERLYTSFNVTIRTVLNIDRCSHRYLIEPLSECLHLKTMIASRYVTFYRSLITSKKMPVRFLARLAETDQRTVLGRTLSSLLLSCNLADGDLLNLDARLVKKMMKYKTAPDDEKWRIPLCQELLNLREGGQLDLPEFTPEEREELLQYVCVS
jgi:hypothetical protein